MWTSPGTCTLFDVANYSNYANMIYDPSLQIARDAVDVSTAVSTPFAMTSSGSLYVAEGIVALANESTVLIHAVVKMDYTPGVANVLSHFEVFLLLNGVVVQTKSVRYLISNFDQKILSFSIIRHMETRPTINLTIISKHPATIVTWKTAVLTYNFSTDCLFNVDLSVCLICNRKLNLKLYKGQCFANQPGQSTLNNINADFSQITGPCSSGTVVCKSAYSQNTSIKCFKGNYLDAYTNCPKCDVSCAECEITINNCTACANNSYVYLKNAGNVQSSCKVCAYNCANCDANTEKCTACDTGYTLLSNKKCAPICNSVETLNSDLLCVTCPSTCANCPTDSVCDACAVGYHLNGTTCSIDPTPVIISGRYDAANRSLVYYFDALMTASIMRSSNARVTVDVSGVYANIDDCFKDAVPSKWCSVNVSFNGLPYMTHANINLLIQSRVNLQGDRVLITQSVKLNNTISFVNESASSGDMNKDGYARYGQATSIVVQSVIGISNVWFSTSAISLLKLNQYIEMIVYLNIKMPSNLQAFLSYFSNDIFGLMVNPFESKSEPGCQIYEKFSENSMNCLALQNIGGFIIIAAIVVVIIVLIHYIQKCSFSRSDTITKYKNFFICGLLDAVYFDLSIGTMSNLAMKTTSTAYGSVNFGISLVVCCVILPIQTAFVAYYSWNKILKPKVLSNLPKLNLTTTLKAKPKAVNHHTASQTELVALSSIPISRYQKLKAYLLNSNLIYYIEEFNTNNKFGKLYLAVYQVKTYIGTALLVMTYNRQLVQIFTVAAVQISFTVLAMSSSPFKNKPENIRENITNVLLSMCMICMAAFAENSTLSEKIKFDLFGNAMIALISAIFFLNIITVLKDVIIKVISIVKIIKNCRWITQKNLTSINEKKTVTVLKVTTIEKSTTVTRSSIGLPRRSSVIKSNAKTHMKKIIQESSFSEVPIRNIGTITSRTLNNLTEHERGSRHLLRRPNHLHSSVVKRTTQLRKTLNRITTTVIN